MDFPAMTDDAEGWLITGSKYGAYEDLPFIPRLEAFIREAYAADIPQVGICFGHQIIAQALGGTVEKFSGGWCIGRTEYDFDGTPLALNAWHQDQVTHPPADATTIAETPFCQHAGLAYKGRAFSVQPHPEFDVDAVELLLKARAPGVVPSPLIEHAATANAQPVANSIIADRIAAFFKETPDHA
ncbi:MAG: type 1 glutamine amidotransferase [Pseudomonadota bacterium]